MALRIPAGALLVPMAMAALLEAMGLVNIVLPPWLLAITYAFLGWSIGLSFNRQILQHAARALLPIMLAIGVMIAVCAALAAVLVHYAGIDPLTAYLATSPGGMDSGGDHRGGQQGRSVLRDGLAGRASRDRANPRTTACPFRRPAAVKRLSWSGRLGAGQQALSARDVGPVDHVTADGDHAGLRIVLEGLHDLLRLGNLLRSRRKHLVDDGRPDWDGSPFCR